MGSNQNQPSPALPFNHFESGPKGHDHATVIRSSMDGELEWVYRIRNSSLERFQQRMHSDLPSEYGQSIGRNKLDSEILDLRNDEISIWWTAGKRRAASMDVAAYTETSLTVTIRRPFSVDAIAPVHEITYEEWANLKETNEISRGKIFLKTDGTTTRVFFTPWTRDLELAVLHGRQLILWLLEWLQVKFDGHYTAVPSDKLNHALEMQELRSDQSFGYHTDVGRRFWQERENEPSEIAQEKSTTTETPKDCPKQPVIHHPGRPSDVRYDIAYKRIVVNGEKPREVYDDLMDEFVQYWIQEYGIEPDAALLEEERKRFRAGVSYRRKSRK